MICPACGKNNADEAALCTGCGYKFRFGHAFNDPARMTFIQPGSSGKAKTGRIVFFSLLLALLIAAVVVAILAR